MKYSREKLAPNIKFKAVLMKKHKMFDFKIEQTPFQNQTIAKKWISKLSLDIKFKATIILVLVIRRTKISWGSLVYVIEG